MRMRRMALLLMAGLTIGCLVFLAIEAAGGWYSYTMLEPNACTAFKNGHYTIDPGQVVPGQPNECYIRTPRFHVP